MAIKLLKEVGDFSYDHEEIKKNQESGGPMVVAGILQRADALNQNGRVYPRSVLEPQLELYKELVKERRAVGCLDHDDLAVVELKNASHVITEIWMEEDGTVKGKLEVLDKLPMGAILKNLFLSNIKVGISSRALGSVSKESSGDVVQDDLHLVCFDIVSEPSTKMAWLSLNESREYSREEVRNLLSRQDRINQAASELLNFQKKIRQG